MKKQGTRWIQKYFTDTTDRTQPNGALHSYDYFEDESGEWVYNICFHHVEGPDVGFPSFHIIEPVFRPIEEVIRKAREQFDATMACNGYGQQPLWND